MNVTQLRRIVDAFVDFYGDKEISDKQTNELRTLLPETFDELLDDLRFGKLNYYESDENYIYIETTHLLEIDKEKTDLEKGYICLNKGKLTKYF